MLNNLIAQMIGIRSVFHYGNPVKTEQNQSLEIFIANTQVDKHVGALVMLGVVSRSVDSLAFAAMTHRLGESQLLGYTQRSVAKPTQSITALEENKLNK